MTEETTDTRRSPLPTKSPKPEMVKKAEMDFYTALRLVAQGKSITRIEWNNPTIHFKILEGRLKIFIQNESEDKPIYHDLIVQEADILAKDWVICNE